MAVTSDTAVLGPGGGEAQRCDMLCPGSPERVHFTAGRPSSNAAAGSGVRTGVVPAGGSPATGLPMSVTLRSGLFFVAAHGRTFMTSLAWVSGTSGIATELSPEHSFSLPLAHCFCSHIDLAPLYDARAKTEAGPQAHGTHLSPREGASVPQRRSLCPSLLYPSANSQGRSLIGPTWVT